MNEYHRFNKRHGEAHGNKFRRLHERAFTAQRSGVHTEGLQDGDFVDMLSVLRTKKSPNHRENKNKQSIVSMQKYKMQKNL